jgi:hypothetical protein
MSDLFEKRYRLQSSAREILGRSRLDTCNRIRIDKTKNVIIRRNADRYSFGNLMQCGLVWVCPVCSAKITERRRVELSQALCSWVGGGRKLLFMTFTLQHDVDNACADVLKKLLFAHGRFWNSRDGKAICKDYHIVGRVRSLETTYGANGWHCHIHVLCFVDYTNDAILGYSSGWNLKNRMSELWIKSLIDTGAIASIERGVTVADADDDIAEYIAKFGFDKKWGMSRELTKPNSKHSSGLSPFQILEFYSDQQWPCHADLFREYVSAFAGKSQLRWSKNCRQLLQLSRELSDTELIKSQEIDTVTVGEIEIQAWRIILGNDIASECLTTLQNGVDALEIMLRDYHLTPYYQEDTDYPVFGLLPF